MRITYAKNTLRASVRYVCTCGHKMTRTNSSFWTRNPFNRDPKEVCDAECEIKMLTQIRNCPKCGKAVSPKLDNYQQKCLTRSQDVVSNFIKEKEHGKE